MPTPGLRCPLADLAQFAEGTFVRVIRVITNVEAFGSTPGFLKSGIAFEEGFCLFLGAIAE